MPSQATRTQTTVKIAELGFDPRKEAVAEVTVDEVDDGTFVEVAYGDEVWTLKFNVLGELEKTPTKSGPGWLGPVVKKAAPQLRVLA
ncbi:hypothetical protein BJ1_gp18 [Halorubrum virus BJ1]|uniref:Uncharacterized protein n=1 Tax=Halorubrum virus BJ1 TaxID=416419 RepID=A0ZYN1_9CAUD|nr:hypothetical protein BJ1_gp18 [Halorubrum virus BJ1]CAL92440.1 hypothetical protein [Halorubrum virus BJ1]